MLTLEIQKRDAKNSLDKLRKGGLMPAVLYGPQEEAAAVALDEKVFTNVWKEAGGSAIVALKGLGDDPENSKADGAGKEVLIQDVVLHPVSEQVLHADFYVIERGKKLTVSIPLEFVGESPVEKQGGVVVKILHEIEIEVRPSDIPQNIEVDLTKLEDLSSTITVGDLKFPESAEVSLEPTDAVASVSEVQEEPEEPVEEERSIEDVEVEEKGKKEDEPAAVEEQEEQSP